MLLKMSNRQRKSVRNLIPLCFNYSEGKCRVLKCTCPLKLSRKSINCNYFIRYVLPVMPQLYKRIRNFNDKIKK